MHALTNELLNVRISPLGAELQSIQSAENNHEYLWQGDPDVWSGRAPILFPIVGALQNGCFTFEQRAYHLPRHGLARTAEFRLIDESKDSVCLELASNADTLKVYPWEFSLQVRFALQDNRVGIEYRVVNTGSESMRFTIGSHPAFRLTNATDNYSIHFSDRENLIRYPLDEAGLLLDTGTSFELQDGSIALHNSLFDDDALVFKDVQSDTITLCDDNDALIRVHTGGAPHLGLWAKPAAPFVCIEPWFGYSDSSGATGQWDEKPAMLSLNAGDEFLHQWSIEVVSLSR